MKAKIPFCNFSLKSVLYDVDQMLIFKKYSVEKDINLN